MAANVDNKSKAEKKRFFFYGDNVVAIADDYLIFYWKLLFENSTNVIKMQILFYPTPATSSTLNVIIVYRKIFS